jgi:hypothetical protein
MLRVLTISAVIALCVFALSVAGLSAWRSWQYYQQQTNQKGSAENATQESRDSAPAELEVVPKESADQAIARYNLWLMVFTGVLAVVSIIQIGFLIAADEKADESARAAKIAAYAARDAVAHSDRNVATQLRAYIFLETFNVTRVINPIDGKPTTMGYQFSGKWKNVGQTPSVKTDAFFSYCLRDRTETGTVVFKVNIPDKQDAVNIGSGLPFATGAIGVSISDILAIMGDKHTKDLFVLSSVNYSDVFGENHTETVASQVEVVNDPNIIDFSGELFRYRAITDYKIERN